MEDHGPIFSYTDQDFVHDVSRSEYEQRTQDLSRFDRALRSGWSEKMRRGLFRYHLGELETRVLPGEAGYVAQLNIQRGIERRKPQEILSIRQIFDPLQFNFNKIKPEEVLFEMCRNKHGPSSTESCVQNGSSGSPSCLVIINVSPLELGHSLLLPEPARCYPQVLTPLAVRFGIETVFLSSDPGYRVGFNSLGGFASVNHLHLHGYYLSHTLKVEWAPTETLSPKKGLYRFPSFPRAFLFYTEAQDLEQTARAVCRLTDILVEENIAHNLFMTRGCPPYAEQRPSALRRGVRVLIWPRVSCFGAKEESAFNVALCELAGHLPFKNKEDFNTIDEDGVKAIVQRYVLSDHEFTQLEKRVLGKL
ncbi:GDP-D-glucose phosphorylase 1 [Hoplias malabaricus]|uniref:GDP-D-glucose phosphorylase 1 n=1 Tax=Hoplias malabaricus TaxID=27720 RepID=UPI0034627B6C